MFTQIISLAANIIERIAMIGSEPLAIIALPYIILILAYVLLIEIKQF